MTPSLIEQAAKGEKEAMAEIVRSHYGAVYRFCARRVGPEKAQDATQETFLAAQKALKRFEERSSLQTWLFGVAQNCCRNLTRKARIEMAALDFWQDHASADEDVGGTVIDREALRQALAKLRPEHREAVLLHEVEGLTYAEAAQVLGVPEGTVKSRLHHAFLQLRRSLTGEETCS